MKGDHISKYLASYHQHKLKQVCFNVLYIILKLYNSYDVCNPKPIYLIIFHNPDSISYAILSAVDGLIFQQQSEVKSINRNRELP